MLGARPGINFQEVLFFCPTTRKSELGVACAWSGWYTLRLNWFKIQPLDVSHHSLPFFPLPQSQLAPSAPCPHNLRPSGVNRILVVHIQTSISRFPWPRTAPHTSPKSKRKPKKPKNITKKPLPLPIFLHLRVRYSNSVVQNHCLRATLKSV